MELQENATTENFSVVQNGGGGMYAGVDGTTTLIRLFVKLPVEPNG